MSDPTSPARPPSRAAMGPKPAQLGAPPARSDPPPPPFRLQAIHVVAIVVVLLALALPVYLAWTSPSVQSAGLTGFVAIFFGCLSVLVGAWRALASRRRPHAQGLAALTAVLAAVGLLVAALGAGAAHQAAFELSSSDHALAPLDRLEQVSRAVEAARTTARLGFSTLPGFALGFLLLLLVVRARRESAPPAPTAAVSQIEPTWRVFVSLFGASALFVVALVLAIRAAFF
jgi:hypothetical protein